MLKFALACCLTAMGCDAAPPPAIPVTGKVFVDGSPADRAVVGFYSALPLQSRTPLATAISEADGTYRPSTYASGDGVPPGDYVVTVAWPRYVEFDGQQIASDDRLQGKYADPAKSTLRATIDGASAEIPPIELTR